MGIGILLCWNEFLAFLFDKIYDYYNGFIQNIIYIYLTFMVGELYSNNLIKYI